MSAPTYPVPAPPVAALLDLAGRVVVVTGASRGIGAGIARRFAEAGATVVVHHRTAGPEAEAVARAIVAGGGRAVAIAADLTREAEVERLMTETVAACGRIDALVNNAGVYPASDLLVMRAADWDAVMEADARSVFLCTRAASRRMIAQARGGAIVNVASIEAANPAPGHAHYGAAKAAVVTLTRAAAQELGPHGIRVNAVAPGLVWREGIERAWADGVGRWHERAPLGRMGMPEDVADACLFLASGAARWIAGAVLVVDGGIGAARLF